MADFQAWKHSVLGIGLDVDGAEGKQCVDVPKSWAQVCFPGVSWRTSIGYGNAKDMFANANPKYFTKITNNHDDTSQLPKQGDIVVFAASPDPDKRYTSVYSNPWGHCAVVESANSHSLYLIQQDGSTGQATVQEVTRPWLYTRCIGWLRPKSAVVASASTSNPYSHKLFLPASVDKWRVYKVSGPWTVGHEIAFLRPRLSPPGLTYTIEKTLAKNVYQIRTQDFGEVAIYAGADTVAQIK